MDPVRERVVRGVLLRPLPFPTVAAALLAGMGLLASWIPSRRAARVDPTVTLRAE